MVVIRVHLRQENEVSENSSPRPPKRRKECLYQIKEFSRLMQGGGETHNRKSQQGVRNGVVRG